MYECLWAQPALFPTEYCVCSTAIIGAISGVNAVHKWDDVRKNVNFS